MSEELGLVGELINIIRVSKENAFKRVNEELIRMYWNVGEALSKASKSASFGDGYARWQRRRARRASLRNCLE